MNEKDRLELQIGWYQKKLAQTEAALAETNADHILQKRRADAAETELAELKRDRASGHTVPAAEEDPP